MNAHTYLCAHVFVSLCVRACVCPTEFSGYVQRNPFTAGELTRKEAGYLSEIAVLAALERGQNVLVDGSLRDAEWHQQYFLDLRRAQPNVRIAILHVTAPRSVVLSRAAARAETTGRAVPRETLEEALEMVPKSVEILKPMTDFFAELHNAEESDGLELKNMSWKAFEANWSQQCHECPSKP